MSYGGGMDGMDGRIGIALDIMRRERARRLPDVERKPEPHDRPEPHAQWDEVRAKWVVWNKGEQRWVIVDDETEQDDEGDEDDADPWES